MNDQLQAALAALLNKTVSGIDAGTQLLSAQLPDVIHQLLLWKATISLIVFVVGIALLVCVLASLRLYRRPPATGKTGTYGAPLYVPSLIYDKEGDITPGIMIVALAQVFTSVVGVGCLTNLHWLQIWLAPKVYLIEYAAHLAK